MKDYFRILPVPNYRIWASEALKERYGYESDLPNIGELYNVIAMKGHLDCTVEQTGEKLSDFFHTHYDLFDSGTPEMPVRAAMACTSAPMSVQVHPGDEYALAHDGRLGKPDGVFFIDGSSSMVLGHNASSREEFSEWADSGQWEKLLRYVPIEKGQFANVPYGTLHAFGAGMVVIEFSQNADLTYRLYDYDRREPDGSPRQLHIQKVKECVNVPDGQIQLAELNPVTKDGIIHTVFHSEPGVYTAGRLEVESAGTFSLPEFYFLIAIDGKGSVDGCPLSAGETILIPCKNGPVHIEGPLDLTYVTYEAKA